MQFHYCSRTYRPVRVGDRQRCLACPPTIDLSPGDANWARYRYRVFETIIPLRNVIWSKDTL